MQYGFFQGKCSFKHQVRISIDKQKHTHWHIKKHAVLLWHSACRIHFHCPQSSGTGSSDRSWRISHNEEGRLCRAGTRWRPVSQLHLHPRSWHTTPPRNAQYWCAQGCCRSHLHVPEIAGANSNILLQRPTNKKISHIIPRHIDAQISPDCATNSGILSWSK